MRCKTKSKLEEVIITAFVVKPEPQQSTAPLKGKHSNQMQAVPIKPKKPDKSQAYEVYWKKVNTLP